jgi:hypothetical protein
VEFMTSSADHWITKPAAPAAPAGPPDTAGPAAFLSRRSYGSLDAITDSERRALRPIGVTAREAAAKTSVLLADLLAIPGVRIFQGVCPAAAEAPRISHAVNSGCRVILVESVAWPPGQYVVMPTGRIHCDEEYIGQSVRPLISAVRRWRSALPRGHRVSAMVVVHPTAGGAPSLPPAQTTDLTWTQPATAVRDIRASLPSGQQAVSIRAVAALASASAEEAREKGARPG